ncbi:hypothetical protein GF339_16290 [candidate division KSB3 bacterium]|uniref:Uncharacterized protein n=1 Tax=candidate division KSB3 bacterium TaxID=2044937 RepID=A0A9D5JXJ2_9BACT|nr:hypothetical protein [candidate division KSB3 bacterium]MBD3326147.1 hypothetical protein [candidate division KSB3 bacterium]
MWIVRTITFLESHPYLFIGLLLILGGMVWFFWREHRRPSYRQRQEVEDLLKGFDEDRNTRV